MIETLCPLCTRKVNVSAGQRIACCVFWTNLTCCLSRRPACCARTLFMHLVGTVPQHGRAVESEVRVLPGFVPRIARAKSSHSIARHSTRRRTFFFIQVSKNLAFRCLTSHKHWPRRVSRCSGTKKWNSSPDCRVWRHICRAFERPPFARARQVPFWSLFNPQ